MGIEIKLMDDIMFIEGGIHKIKGGKVYSQHDHRIAMACAIAGLRASGDTKITDADAIKKSYPGFYEDIRKIGVKLTM
jgi:3-phosphoshikimate 1-carboxyvinyltransferase